MGSLGTEKMTPVAESETREGIFYLEADPSEVKKELATRHLYDFAKQAWKVVEPSTPFVPNWHLKALCEHLEAVTRGEILQLMINMPPRFSKSLFVSVFWPAWVWVRYPEKRFLFSSYNYNLSIRDNVKCRRILESRWYQSFWAEKFRMTSDQNEKSRFENDHTGVRLVTSVGGSGTGEGGDFIVCDDPHNIKDAHSEGSLEETCSWWDEVMTSRVNDPLRSSKVIVAQRVGYKDLCGHLLRNGGFDHLCLPMVYEKRVDSKRPATSIGWEDPRRKTGELLWPERFPPGVVKELRKLGSYVFDSQYQQRPGSEAGEILKEVWWHYYNALPLVFDEIIQSWDAAFKDLKTSSFVAGQVWGRRQAQFYLLDQTRDKLDFVGTCKAIVQMTEKWPKATKKLVEDKANGPAIISSMRQSVVGLIPVNPEGSKVARAYAVSPLTEAGNVFLPNPQAAPWVKEFVRECKQFPGGEYNDQVDAATQALSYLGLGKVYHSPEAAPTVVGKRVSYWGLGGKSRRG